MKIKIFDEIYLRSDELNYIISERCIKEKDGTEYWVDKTFHRTPSQALESVATRTIRKSHATTFEGLLKEYNRMNKVLEEIDKKLNLEITKTLDKKEKEKKK